MKVERARRRGATTAIPAKAADVPELGAGQTSGPADSDYERISRLAYSYWEARGGKGGSPEEDWNRAEQEILRERGSGEL